MKNSNLPIIPPIPSNIRYSRASNKTALAPQRGHRGYMPPVILGIETYPFLFHSLFWLLFYVFFYYKLRKLYHCYRCISLYYCISLTGCTFPLFVILIFFILNICFITCPSGITDIITRAVARRKLLERQMQWFLRMLDQNFMELFQKDTPTQVCCHEYCKIFENIFL